MPINFDLSAGIIVTIFIFIISQAIVIHNKKKETKGRISRACKSLKIDIDNLFEWYIAQYNDEFVQKKGYVQNIINTVPYNGIVNSGLITHLKKETQDKLNEFYAYATLHNKRMFELARIYNDKASTSDFNYDDLISSAAWGLNELELIQYETKMKDLRSDVKDLLEKEIDDQQSLLRKFFRLKHTYKS